MNAERSDFDRALRTWFEDGPTVMSDRVVDTIADRIARQPQRRTWRLRGRPVVNTYLKLAAGLAAVAIVAAVGYSLLPGRTGPGAPTAVPTPSAQPTSAVTAAPSAKTVCPTWYADGCSTGAGILPAGSQATRAFTPAFTFSVPEGWVNGDDEPGFYQLFPDTPANQTEFARSAGLAQSIYMGPHTSPWFVCKSVENNAGATAAEMVAALVANEALATTGLVDVVIGGLSGKQFDVRLDPDWTGSCPPSPDDPPDFDIMDYRVRGILLDARDRGVIVIFLESLYSADYEAFLAEAMPIVESFAFELAQ